MIKQILFLLIFTSMILPQVNFEKDTFDTNSGKLEITFIGHGTLMFSFDSKIIHVDPYSKLADYSKLPDADIILITHHHGDHLDKTALSEVSSEKTTVLLTETALKTLGETNHKNYIVMQNGDTQEVSGIKIEAVPAYNIENKRDGGEPFHPKGVGNGYILTLGDKRIYIAGDTENIPEMKNFKNIDIAFIPMNLPYTMTPEMAAKSAEAIHPHILYPYHYGDTNVEKLVKLLGNEKGIEIRIRNMN